jgi:hypothetical protein
MVVSVLAGPAFGDAFEWTGAAGNVLWGDGGNWTKTGGTSGRTFPNDTGDSATITSFGSDLVVDVSSSFSVGALTAGNASHKLTLGGSGALTTSGADWNSQGVVQFDIDVGMGNFKDLEGAAGGMTIIGSGSTFTSSRQPRLRHPFRIFGKFKATCGTSGVDFVVDGSGRLLLNNTAGSATGTGNSLVVGRQNWVGSTSVVLGGVGSTDSDLIIGAGGTLAPGNSTGTLSAENVTFEAGSTYEWEFGEGSSDLLAVDGNITIEDDNDFTIDITDLRGGPFGTLDLMTYGGTLDGDPDLWTINLPPRVTFNDLNDTGDAIQITGVTPRTLHRAADDPRGTDAPDRAQTAMMFCSLSRG